MLKRFFIPDTPAGYWPGDLISKIAERDLTQLEGGFDGLPAALKCKAGSVTVRERVKRDFLQFTAIPVFEMGQAEGDMKLSVRHSGALRRTELRFIGDEELAAPLRCEEVSEVLMPLDFTRLEVTGSPQSFKLEIETYGGTQVVMRLPRVRRYVPMGEEQSALLVSAFDVIANAYDQAETNQMESHSEANV